MKSRVPATQQNTILLRIETLFLNNTKKIWEVAQVARREMKTNGYRSYNLFKVLSLDAHNDDAFEAFDETTRTAVKT